MISDDTYIDKEGKVHGTLKYVESFPEFNQANPLEQKGNYFPVTLSETGNKMTLKKNGVAAENKTDMSFDKDIIILVGSKSDKFTIEVDSREVITLNFEEAELQTQ